MPINLPAVKLSWVSLGMGESVVSENVFCIYTRPPVLTSWRKQQAFKIKPPKKEKRGRLHASQWLPTPPLTSLSRDAHRSPTGTADALSGLIRQGARGRGVGVGRESARAHLARRCPC